MEFRDDKKFHYINLVAFSSVSTTKVTTETLDCYSETVPRNTRDNSWLQQAAADPALKYLVIVQQFFKLVPPTLGVVGIHVGIKVKFFNLPHTVFFHVFIFINTFALFRAGFHYSELGKKMPAGCFYCEKTV